MDAREAMMARQRERAAKKRGAKKGPQVMSATGNKTTHTQRRSSLKDVEPAAAEDSVVGGLSRRLSASSMTGAAAAPVAEDGDKTMSKFEMKMKEQAFEDVYNPDELRFEPVAPVATTVSATLESEVPGIGPPQGLEVENLEKFVLEPAPQGAVVKCRILRDRKGVDKGMYPTYYVKLEQPDGDQTRLKFLLAGRKRKRSKASNYLITTDPTDLNRDSDAYVGKLRSNMIGTKFQLFGAGDSADKPGAAGFVRDELCAIHYETNLLGFKGPRKMSVLLPPVDSDTGVRETILDAAPDALGKRLKDGDLDKIFLLGNKKPMWNEDTNSYVLNFHGRVTQASVKNFQIVHASDEDYVVLQFGRIDEHEFTMDFRYPMSAIQAFGVCLSSFDGKLACE